MSLLNYVGYVGSWVAWVASIENLRRSCGLRGSIKFWGGSKNGLGSVGRSFPVSGVGP